MKQTHFSMLGLLAMQGAMISDLYCGTKQIPGSHPATSTGEYIQSLKDKAQAKRDRKLANKLRK